MKLGRSRAMSPNWAGPSIGSSLAFGLMLGLGSCVTATGPVANGLEGATIVERSKESPPSWTTSKPNVLSSAELGDTFSLVYFKDRLLNLPLGIKQAQISALDLSHRALEELLKEQVVSLAKASATPAKTQTPEIDRQIASTVKLFHSKNARVQDMYFERLAHEPPLEDGAIRETYRVFVLVNITKKGVSELLDSLGRRLVDSSDLSMRNLGLLIKREAKQITSH